MFVHLFDVAWEDSDYNAMSEELLEGRRRTTLDSDGVKHMF